MESRSDTAFGNGPVPINGIDLRRFTFSHCSGVQSRRAVCSKTHPPGSIVRLSAASATNAAALEQRPVIRQ